jgi:uncharacterized protein (DUF608 family)
LKPAAIAKTKTKTKEMAGKIFQWGESIDSKEIWPRVQFALASFVIRVNSFADKALLSLHRFEIESCPINFHRIRTLILWSSANCLD